MTPEEIETRIVRLESIVADLLPTNGRHASAFAHTSHSHHDASLTGSGPVERANYGDVWYTIGEQVAISGRPSTDHYTIKSFTPVTAGYYASLQYGDRILTVPLSDLIPIITGSMSANWMEKHGMKDWEITAFRTVASGKIGRPKNAEEMAEYFNEDKSVSSGYWEIYEVRRADGTVWKIGDETTEGRINKWELGKDGVAARIGESDAYHINQLHKSAVTKDWDIIEFRVPSDLKKSRAWILDSDGYYYPYGQEIKHGSPCVIEQMMKFVTDGHYCIWSIRRASDGEVFVIGDMITYPRSVSHTISYFTIHEGEVFINSHFIGTPLLRIKDWIKDKGQPIFTTADGVPAYEGDVIYWLAGGGFGNLTGHVQQSEVSKSCDSICFPYGYSTRTAAEAAYEKWLYEQPVLTLNDIKGSINWIDQARLESLVKDKLTKG